MLRLLVRFYVGPPNVTSRLMFLRNLLNKENLEFGFSFDQLAEATEGYSEGDLKVIYTVLIEILSLFLSLSHTDTHSKHVVMFLLLRTFV